MSTVAEHITDARAEAIRVQVLEYIEANQDMPIVCVARDLTAVFGITPEQAGLYMAQWVKQ